MNQHRTSPVCNRVNMAFINVILVMRVDTTKTQMLFLLSATVTKGNGGKDAIVSLIRLDKSVILRCMEFRGTFGLQSLFGANKLMWGKV